MTTIQAVSDPALKPCTTSRFDSFHWCPTCQWVKGDSISCGRAAPNLTTLFAVTAALSDVVGRPVAIADLFAGEGDVAINDQLTVGLSALRAALSGEPVHVPLAGAGALTAGAVGLPGTLRESDMRMCKSIGVDLGTGAAAMAKLWGKPFSAERDSRAEPGANAQRKGQISRQLKAELLSTVQPTKREGQTE